MTTPANHAANAERVQLVTAFRRASEHWDRTEQDSAHTLVDRGQELNRAAHALIEHLERNEPRQTPYCYSDCTAAMASLQRELKHQAEPHGRNLDSAALVTIREMLTRDASGCAGTAVQMIDAMLSQAEQPSIAYSIDADPQGIRTRAAQAITGAQAFGAQGSNPPPDGHWLEPFWLTAKAQSHDTAILNWLSSNLLAADFGWGDPATPVIVIEIPKTAGVTGDLRRDVLAILAKQGGAA